MSSDIPGNNASRTPRLHTARSFTRLEPSRVSPFARSRAKTVQTLTIAENIDATPLSIPLTGDYEENAGPDLFEKRDSSDSGLGDGEQHNEEAPAQDQLEELPIELISLTDRYGGLLALLLSTLDSLITNL